MRHILLAASLCLAFSSLSLAATCSGQSPAHSVALLELYTSEGCDSCPPADRYVAGLRQSGVTAQQAVMLSMHVDYWNYIGWKDPFSRAAFTARQRWMSDLANSRTIYTPEIFVGGRELRNWDRTLASTLQQINAKPAQADLRISLDGVVGGALRIDVQASAAQNAKLYVALVEDSLVSQVKSGENRGRTLRHDFVVREWLDPVELAREAKSGKHSIGLVRAVSVPKDAVPAKLGLTAFVQSDKGEVLQAFSLPLCGS